MQDLRGIATPHELGILAEALAYYCKAEGIEPGSRDHEAAAHMIMSMFCSGVVSAEEMAETLKRARANRVAA